MSAPRARPTIALDGPGRRSGQLVLPWSRNDSGWGALHVPFGVLSNGSGPTLLLTGGSHGDEIEGPLALFDLFRTLDLARLSGTVFVLPALNAPAVRAGLRLSPIDGGNMNRAFRRRRDGTLTEQIADFVEAELVARANAVLDIHSGGRTMMFHPFAVSHLLASADQTARARAALLAFGAPVGLMLSELDNEGMLDTAVEEAGKLFLSTELGGGGSTTPAMLAIARRGILNLMIHLGMLDLPPQPPPTPTRLMTNDAAGYLASERGGMAEYLVELGSEVRRGAALLRLYDLDRLDAAPEEMAAPADGVLLGRLHGGVVRPGDFLALIARDL